MLGIARSSYYYQPQTESEENLFYMKRIDELYTEYPFYGSRKITAALSKEGHLVNRKRIQRLMRLMGLEAIYPKPKTTVPSTEHRIYPYLLRGVLIDRPNQVWSTDITYVRMKGGFMYLVAVIDWHSRYVLSWNVSNTMDTEFCLDALDQALSLAQPEIFNTDQGCQFTALKFTERLLAKKIQISMDGKGRALDNIFVERLWRSVKYENIYLMDYRDGLELCQGLEKYFHFYNQQRPHQSLNDLTPQELYLN